MPRPHVQEPRAGGPLRAGRARAGREGRAVSPAASRGRVRPGQWPGLWGVWTSARRGGQPDGTGRFVRAPTGDRAGTGGRSTATGHAPAAGPGPWVRSFWLQLGSEGPAHPRGLSPCPLPLSLSPAWILGTLALQPCPPLIHHSTLNACWDVGPLSRPSEPDGGGGSIPFPDTLRCESQPRGL